MYLSEQDLKALRKRIPRGGQADIHRRLESKGVQMANNMVNQALHGKLKSDLAKTIIEEALAYAEEHEAYMQRILDRIHKKQAA